MYTQQDPLPEGAKGGAGRGLTALALSPFPHGPFSIFLSSLHSLEFPHLSGSSILLDAQAKDYGEIPDSALSVPPTPSPSANPAGPTFKIHSGFTHFVPPPSATIVSGLSHSLLAFALNPPRSLLHTATQVNSHLTQKQTQSPSHGEGSADLPSPTLWPH